MFKKNKEVWKPSTSSVVYPKWTCVQVASDYFLVLEKTKKKFISERAFRSWNYYALPATRESVAKYPLNGQLGFRSGTLVQPIGTHQQYFVADDKMRLIATPDFYDVLGFKQQDAMIISLDEFEFHARGLDIRSI